jgi:hypothetical protein
MHSATGMVSRKVLLEPELSQLNEDERIQILAVINKDEIVRVHHELHVM